MNLSDFVLIDLSVSFAPSVSEAVPVDIQYMNHECGGVHLAELAGVRPEDLPSGMGWASERISAITHSTTHIDAPYHYAPTCAGGLSRTIDQIPLDWFWGPGVCIPVDKPPQQVPVSIEELNAFEDENDYQVNRGDVVLFRTGAGSFYGLESYNEYGRGLSPALIETLCSRGVRLLGTDASSIDQPFSLMRKRSSISGAKHVWESHFVGRLAEFCAVEKLANLDHLPAVGFWVACFPLKVLRGSAAWTRAVAFLPGVNAQ